MQGRGTLGRPPWDRAGPVFGRVPVPFADTAPTSLDTCAAFSSTQPLHHPGIERGSAPS